MSVKAVLLQIQFSQSEDVVRSGNGSVIPQADAI
jgi:hypothetical protein